MDILDDQTALTNAAESFAAIGAPARLTVLLTLVHAGPDGLSVGDIQTKTDMPASTLAHHLRILVSAGLVKQSKEGRTVTNIAQFENLESLANFVLQECCKDAGPTSAQEKH